MAKIDWEFCQQNSDTLLAEGLKLLRDGQPSASEVPPVPGNYLMSADDGHAYIGEAKDLRARLRQQCKPATSTCYKNYLADQGEAKGAAVLELSGFEVRYILTRIGRKELEEFGIVHLPATLNRFQLGKRARFLGSAGALWRSVQANTDAFIEGGERALLNAAPVRWRAARPPDAAGLYFLEHVRHGPIYIGESSSIQGRYEVHSGQTYFSALRRNVGEDVLGFRLRVRNGRRRYFSDTEDARITEFLAECTVRALEVTFGRIELEEHMIRAYGPLLNRKENR